MKQFWLVVLLCGVLLHGVTPQAQAIKIKQNGLSLEESIHQLQKDVQALKAQVHQAAITQRQKKPESKNTGVEKKLTELERDLQQIKDTQADLEKRMKKMERYVEGRNASPNFYRQRF